MTRESIANATRSELVEMAKANGVKANQKTDALREQLTALVPAKSQQPKEYWAIYNSIKKAHPEYSKKRLAVVARCAYQKRYAVAVEAE